MWLIENIDVIIGIVCLLSISIFSVYKFIQLGKEQQLEKIQEWLLFAVTQAEKELGGNTGQLKLRMVYGQFIDKFKFIALLITFEEFSEMVDNALDIMRNMLSQNNAVKQLVEGEKK